jgi:hypothetical protein
MTPDARRAEVAAILATGYRRWRLREQEVCGSLEKPLDDRAPVERSCGSVNAPRNNEEVA